MSDTEKAALERRIYDRCLVRVGQLEAENAKLRELALALADCRNTTCDDCVRWDYPEGGCSLDVVMRELGVEE